MQQTKKSIELKLVTEITDGPRKETVTMESEGQLFLQDDSTTLTYKEEMEGIGLVNTIIKIKEEEVLIMRSGPITMRHVFQKGETTHGQYKSPAGVMDMKAKTEHFLYQFQDKAQKGKFTLAYKLQLQNEDVGRHRIMITFKEA